MAEQRSWFVRHQGKERGPFSSKQLKHLANTSQIGPDTPIRRSSGGEFFPASNVERLFSGETTRGEGVPAQANLPAAPTAAVPAPIPVDVPVAPVSGPVSQVSPNRLPCPFCGEEILETAVKCRHCNEFLDGRATAQPQQVLMQAQAPVPAPAPNVNVVVNQQTNVGVAGRRWSPILAMFLSFLIPGLGQLYKGQLINAVVWFIVVVIGYIALIIPGVILHLCCIAGAGMSDARR